MSYLRLSINYLLSGVYGILFNVYRNGSALYCALYHIYIYGCVLTVSIHIVPQSPLHPFDFVTRDIPIPRHKHAKVAEHVYMNIRPM